MILKFNLLCTIFVKMKQIYGIVYKLFNLQQPHVASIAPRQLRLSNVNDVAWLSFTVALKQNTET